MDDFLANVDMVSWEMQQKNAKVNKRAFSLASFDRVMFFNENSEGVITVFFCCL